MPKWIDMLELLMNSLITHYNLPVPTISDWFLETEEKYFEIEDTNTGDIKLLTAKGAGMGRFSNNDSIHITIINYDKFITFIQDDIFKNGRKRCDIFLDSSNNRFFILGEIKDQNILNKKSRNKVKKGAREQLLSSLQTILAVPEIVAYSSKKSIKRCCYFNKQSASPAPLNASKAFNRLPNIYPDGFKISNLDIEAFGFEFYEYTGAQTMVLLN